MRPSDWTPVVLVTASLSLTVVLGVFVASPYLATPFDVQPGPTQARRHLASEVDVWVGEMGPGLTGVLRPVWGETGPDRAHDERLNQELDLPTNLHLAWYRLLLFNTSDEEREVVLADGALAIRPEEEGADLVPLRSVAGLVERGEAAPTDGLAAVLGPRGSLRETVVVPRGMMADLLVAFERRVALGEAEEVASAAGGPFRRRPMTRRDLEGLVTDPEAARIEDL